jgi:hypothetical protein
LCGTVGLATFREVLRGRRDRLILVVLPQGAAQHYVDGRHGVKNPDVWRFYPAVPVSGGEPTSARSTSTSPLGGCRSR